jgi:DNA-binding transcriptional ArsR family regulator
VIDRLRKEIQERLDQLLAEADRLRKALAALDPRSGPPPSPSGALRRSGPAAPRQRSERASRAGDRTAPGATRARVLAAMSDTAAMTAGEVAAATGLDRRTVSTTLTRLAKGGDVVKADRGYLLPTSSPSAETTAATKTAGPPAT